MNLETSKCEICTKIKSVDDFKKRWDTAHGGWIPCMGCIECNAKKRARLKAWRSLPEFKRVRPKPYLPTPEAIRAERAKIDAEIRARELAANEATRGGSVRAGEHVKQVSANFAAKIGACVGYSPERERAILPDCCHLCGKAMPCGCDEAKGA